MQKILILGYVWPEPNSSAAGTRMMELLALFRAQGWQVVFASAAALSEHRADLSALQVEEKSITLNCASFDQFIAGYQPDMVLFDRFFTEEQFGWRVEQICPDALRVLDTSDLHSLRHARQTLLKQAQQNCRNESEKNQLGAVEADPASLYAVMAEDDMAQREIAAIYRCDLTLMISEFEMGLLQQQFGVPAPLLHHCNLMLIRSEVSLPAFSERQHFLSIGNFRHAPNWDAVLWLKHAIWPRIRQALPQAQLQVVGAYPPPKATALHNAQQGFHVRGWIPDAQQAMAQARVCLAPLRFGAGIKGKLADAMACGTPSVTTRIGSEGMCGDLPWGGAIAQDTDTFASAAVGLYQDEGVWRQAQERGRIILAQYFCRAQAAQDLLARLAAARQQQDERRRQNFTGTMLRHHLHKSTQYMAQWIAAKNQLSG
ncbi:MAG: glycosyltransferase [Undibacterium sp.]|uniref:glycosyltransferase n=1 Tax=Undibacterium sp. TaxID=1914977 RepID=UPI00271B2262|nr:glycosyltransferase [Undibacterium sp.]MDO8653711.1 glycosyltransferase [Undibacterium sp.]